MRVKKGPPPGRGEGVGTEVRTGHIPERLGRPEWDLLLHSSIVCAGRGILCKPVRRGPFPTVEVCAIPPFRKERGRMGHPHLRRCLDSERLRVRYPPVKCESSIPGPQKRGTGAPSARLGRAPETGATRGHPAMKRLDRRTDSRGLCYPTLPSAAADRGDRKDGAPTLEGMFRF